MSAKPWEQEWQTNDREARTVETQDGYAVADCYPASEKGGVAECFEVAQFIHAAPRLYRALEALVEKFASEGGSQTSAEYVEAQAALDAARGEE